MTFYEFMKARENIRLVKEAGAPWPWTGDPILQEYKFTNVKREHDRTTKWMRENWTKPHHNRHPSEVLFNCALFRYFGTIEFADRIGWQYDFGRSSVRRAIKEIAAELLANKKRVFTGAYVITNQGMSAPKQEVVVDYFLHPFHGACDRLVILAEKTKSWKAVAKEMMRLQGFGGSGFMTKEILQDALHSGVFVNGCDDRNTYCPIGPGARRGLNRLAGRDLSAKPKTLLEEAIRLFEAREGEWPKGWIELELHDIQFQLCEYDKYERVRLGEGRPRNRYRRKPNVGT